MADAPKQPRHFSYTITADLNVVTDLATLDRMAENGAALLRNALFAELIKGPPAPVAAPPVLASVPAETTPNIGPAPAAEAPAP